MSRFDLHIHTYASDGIHSPAEVVHKAKQAGLTGIAITDHDTVAGVQEAKQAGQEMDIMVISGVEVSSHYQGKEVHILGYQVDTEDSNFLERLHDLRNQRNQRNQQILKNLMNLGMNVTMQEVIDFSDKKGEHQETIGRPHIAEALVRKGYVTSMKQAFDQYLGQEGSAYVSQHRIQPSDAVQWIHDAGGKAVIAHPGLIGDDKLIVDIIHQGIDGIEVAHSDHCADEEKKYRELAGKYKLLITAGSDFHGTREGQVYHGFIGSRSIEYEHVMKL